MMVVLRKPEKVKSSSVRDAERAGTWHSDQNMVVIKEVDK